MDEASGPRDEEPPIPIGLHLRELLREEPRHRDGSTARLRLRWAEASPIVRERRPLDTQPVAVEVAVTKTPHLSDAQSGEPTEQDHEAIARGDGCGEGLHSAWGQRPHHRRFVVRSLDPLE